MTPAAAQVRQALFAKGQRGKRKPKIGRLPRWLHPDSVAREYTSDLIAFIRELRAVAVEAMPDLNAAVKAAEQEFGRYDDALTVRSFEQKLREAAAKQPKAATARKAMNATANFNKTQRNKVVHAAIGVDVFAAEPWLAPAMDAAVAGNVSLITRMEENVIGEIGELVSRAGRGGIRAEDLAEQILKRFDVSESRAQLIARDQVSKFNGELTAIRQRQLGVSKYTWRTSMDERVRDTHHKEGNVYAWNDPPADTGHPGEDIQCRCYAEPNFDDLLEGL